MIRGALLLLLFLASPVIAAPEKWYDAYERGVAAVGAKKYREGAAALQRAIAEMPQEGLRVRAGRDFITYTPHFWLGIAKFNQGDVDGALREWRISEEQGVIARTEYYASLRDWVARAQLEKQRGADAAASAPRKAADAALSRALEMQLVALRAGGDRTDGYQQGQRILQDARTRFQKAGTDVAAYRQAEALAQQAVALFSAAADEGKRLKAARPAAVPQPKKPQPKPAEIPVAVDTAAATATVAPPTPPVPVESEARVDARIAVQAYRRSVLTAPRSVADAASREAEKLRIRLEADATDAEYAEIAREARERDAALAAARRPARPVAPQSELATAYRAFAAGDLALAERLLSELLAGEPLPAAYLLRGCTRYTRAMLARATAEQLAAADADFRAALQRDRRLRLDPALFSPKLIAHFERVRTETRK